MKRILVILILCATILVPTSLAYWEPVHTVTPVNQTTELRIANFPFIAPSSKFQYDSSKAKTYKQYDVVLSDGKYYVITNRQACAYEGCADPKNITSMNYTPYTLISIDYHPNQLYPEKSVVRENGILYTSDNIGSASGQRPSNGGYNGWVPNVNFKFPSKFVLKANTYIVSNKTIYLLSKDLEANAPTIYPDHYSSLYKDQYSPSVSYKAGNAVFYDGKVYYVNNAQIANQGAPGTLYGGWQGINDDTWNNYNLYKKDGLVQHNGSVYQALDNNVKAEPGTAPFNWNKLGEINYQPFNTYKVNSVVIYNNNSYRALKTTTNVAPGDTSAWALQQ